MRYGRIREGILPRAGGTSGALRRVSGKFAA